MSGDCSPLAIRTDLDRVPPGRQRHDREPGVAVGPPLMRQAVVPVPLRGPDRRSRRSSSSRPCRALIVRAIHSPCVVRGCRVDCGRGLAAAAHTGLDGLSVAGRQLGRPRVAHLRKEHARGDGAQSARERNRQRQRTRLRWGAAVQSASLIGRDIERSSAAALRTNMTGGHAASAATEAASAGCADEAFSFVDLRALPLRLASTARAVAATPLKA